MANVNSKPWRVLALRANIHLGTARLLLDLVLDGVPQDSVAEKLRSVKTEVASAQGCVRTIAGIS